MCWFHLTLDAPPAALRASGAYGWLGVEVFFVISGFVIPYALCRAGYHLNDFWRFFAKRVARVDPPYLASIAVSLAIAFAAARVPGSRAVFEGPSATRLLLHLAYAIPLAPGHGLDSEWLNPVFWTLAIEFQYYLLIGLVFPLVASRREAGALLTALTLLVASTLLPAKAFLPSHAALFVLGIYVFRFRAGLTSRAALGLVMAAVVVTCAATRGFAPAIAGAATAAVILSSEVWAGLARLRVATLLGRVSYSLYLLHIPVGVNAVAVSRRFVTPTTPFGELIARLIGVLASVVAAYVFYRLVERPAQHLASRIRYHRQNRASDLRRIEPTDARGLERVPDAALSTE